MKTLFVSDLDGTLMQPDATLSPVTVRLLNKAIDAGRLFSVATARTPATVVPIMERVHMRIPAVVITGAALFDTSSHVYSHVRRMSADVARELVELYRATDTSTFMFALGNDNLIRIYHLCGELLPLQQQFYEERLHSPFKRFCISCDGSDTLPEDFGDTILFYTMLPDAKARETYGLIKGIAGVRAQYYHDIYGPQTGILEAFASDASKASAVETLAAETGADRIVCFGDNINDLPMMRVADVAVAVENALPEVKEAADIVIGPNTEDSVARFIDDF